MDQLSIMRIYVAVAEAQGFAAAARHLKISPPAVTRAVSALEDKLGVKLLTRTTRHVRTTDAGRRYLDDARRILHDVERADAAAIGINAEPKGLLSITAPVLFGQKFVMPGIVEYLNAYPDTQVNAVFLDRVVNLLEEGFDVGIRIGKLPDSNMYATVVGKVRLILVASPEYLAKYESPKDPKDLLKHCLISANAGSMAHDWHFNSGEKKQSIHIHPRLVVTSNQAAINASCEGLGITRLISYQVADELAAGTLNTILEDYEPEPMPVHILHREGHRASSKVRCFIALMTKHLRDDTNFQ
ncbi:MAG: DNA-binding transcriptional LysR family regulator [Flavobacteriales bacterium]|jgi:DNA-binding transcriptional LysR family regulator